jgi:hypothetical protein
MGRHLPTATIEAPAYVRAWQATGEPEARDQQIRLTLEVGRALDRFTRNPVLRHSLRLMRRPASAAGLATLQTFLERGFETFRTMGGADRFLEVVAQRETALGTRLFAPDAVACATGLGTGCPAGDDPLGQLP